MSGDDLSAEPIVFGVFCSLGVVARFVSKFVAKPAISVPQSFAVFRSEPRGIENSDAQAVLLGYVRWDRLRVRWSGLGFRCFWVSTCGFRR